MKNKTTKCNKWLVGLALVASIAFSGCGGSMPKCDDKEVLDLVTQLVRRNPFLCKKDDPCQVEEFSYSTFVMNSVDKEAKVISCVAKIDKPELPLYGFGFHLKYIARYTLDGQLLVSLDLF